ncbi:hypothetical protein SAMN05421858_3680 [Haladaptatus litoreus]|uniref:DUF7835 domain-containing protein n=1 Tax=Haladaptatus litoreus TaxID=553468 RepID=A0A1N7DJW7_9EURY|nr:hypothetical protein SAMN05421858_3680 [Haladaptatus litoreus]
MSTPQLDSTKIVEQCENCAAKTPHTVTVDLVTESDKEETVAYSREPYRITECTQCETETRQRMNNV